LCYFKYAVFQSFIDSLFTGGTSHLLNDHAQNHHLFFIGISYFSFKIFQFLIECQ
jgi:D-alanyl-lipoteichoic acid acyltransferase DltB (MBOAT superfamily)